MRRIVSLILGLLAIILATSLVSVWNQSNRRESLIQTQSAKIDNLEAQLKAAQTTAQNGTIQEQTTCAQQAEHMFHALGYSRRERCDGGDDFMSRYQPDTHRCFLKIESSYAKAGQSVVSKSVVDAISREPLGVYMWISEKDKKYWEVAPMECFVFDLNGTKQHCKSDEEFENLARKYMN
jgi:hypothetical protein